MKENEEKYEKECHSMLEENKKLKLENIELESKVSKYEHKLSTIKNSLEDLKIK